MPLTFDARRLWLQANERLDGFRGSRLGPCLKQFAEKNQRNDGRAAFEINMLIQPEQRHHRRKSPRHAGSESHQHIHVGAAATQSLVGAIVKTPAYPELHRCRQRQLQPERQLVVMGMFAKHEEHLPDKREGQGDRNPETPDFATVNLKFRCFFPFARTGVDHLGRKSRLRHRSNHRRFIRRRGQTYPCPLGGQIDVRLHAGLPVENLFQTRRTGSARHAADGKFNDPAIAVVHLTSNNGQARS